MTRERNLTLQAELRVMELESLRIGLRQQRPPPLLHVDIQRGFYQLGDCALRRDHDVHWAQAPLHSHVQEQLRQPLPPAFRQHRFPGDCSRSSEQIRMASRPLKPRWSVGLSGQQSVE
ncbi:hypothetical protein ACLOJK_033479 [Asimina triloba]